MLVPEVSPAYSTTLHPSEIKQNRKQTVRGREIKGLMPNFILNSGRPYMAGSPWSAILKRGVERKTTRRNMCIALSPLTAVLQNQVTHRLTSLVAANLLTRGGAIKTRYWVVHLGTHQPADLSPPVSVELQQWAA